MNWRRSCKRRPVPANYGPYLSGAGNPEFNSPPPAEPPRLAVAIPRERGRSVPQVKLTEVQKLILQRDATGFRRNGAFKGSVAIRTFA